MVRVHFGPPHKRPKWGVSSAGRAPALQAGGHRFDPGTLHHQKKRLTEAAMVVGVSLSPLKRNLRTDSKPSEAGLNWRGETITQGSKDTEAKAYGALRKLRD